MPYDEADETDPMLLVGVELPAEAGASEELCRVFAEEFARMGFDSERLLALFREPFYAGAHNAYLALGDDAVRAIVGETVAVWGRVRYHERERNPDTGLVELSVLDRVGPLGPVDSCAGGVPPGGDLSDG